jgi:hypothetical protein
MAEILTDREYDLILITIDRVLEAKGIKVHTTPKYITQNKAQKIIGKTRLKKAMVIPGLVDWYPTDTRIMVNLKDVLKIANKPI